MENVTECGLADVGPRLLGHNLSPFVLLSALMLLYLFDLLAKSPARELLPSWPAHVSGYPSCQGDAEGGNLPLLEVVLATSGSKAHMFSF